MGSSGGAAAKALFGEILIYQQPGKGEGNRVHVGMHGGLCKKAAADGTGDYGAAPSVDDDM